MSKFLFDMDGVLCDWEGSFIPVYGIPGRMLKEELDKIKKKLAASDFYLNLDILPEGMKLFERLSKIGEVAILTSVGKFDSESVAEQKRKWLIDKLGYLPEFYYVTTSKDKAKFSKMGILIDDRVKAVMPFRNAGGKAILFQDSEEQAVRDINAL